MFFFLSFQFIAYGTLPPEVEATPPDYTIYPQFKRAIGFLTGEYSGDIWAGKGLSRFLRYRWEAVSGGGAWRQYPKVFAAKAMRLMFGTPKGQFRSHAPHSRQSPACRSSRL